MATKKKGLGKGLDALLSDAFTSAKKQQTRAEADATPKAGGLNQQLQTIDDIQRSVADSKVVSAPSIASSTNEIDTNSADRVQQIPVEQCQRGRYQPRRAMDEQSLEELAQSIKSQGVMQPITLRPLQAVDAGGIKYEIIAGERRWRATQLAGLDTVPAIVRELTDEAAIAMALIENLQRDDLNPMEEAYALERLQLEFELTHQQIADTVGKSRAAVSNSLRLLSLCKEVKQLLENGDIEMGHARALLPLAEKDQPRVAFDVVERALTVRQTEALVKETLEPVAKKVKEAPEIDPNISHLQSDLEGKLGVPVLVKHQANGGGQLTLKYNSLDELDGILAHIK